MALNREGRRVSCRDRKPAISRSRFSHLLESHFSVARYFSGFAGALSPHLGSSLEPRDREL